MMSSMPQSLFDWNAEVLQTPNVSICPLPSLFVVKRFPNPYRKVLQGMSEEDANVACVMTSTRVPSHPNPIWRVSVLQHPTTVTSPTHVFETMDTWLQMESHTIIIQRKSSDPLRNNKLFATTVTFTGFALKLNSGHVIPILKFDSPCLILPVRFCLLLEKESETYRFTCKQPPIQTLFPIPMPTAPPPPSHSASFYTEAVRIPQHIINGYIENLVAQEKTCPIEQTPLALETTSITPCGHAMQTEALHQWLIVKQSCPICRSSCTAASLQTWKQ